MEEWMPSKYIDIDQKPKGKYKKPTMAKEAAMTFPYDIIYEQNGKKIVCRQCSGCHGCR